MTTLEQEVLNFIRVRNGCKRVDISTYFNGEIIQMITLGDLRMILAELLALGEVTEIQYVANGIREFFYIPHTNGFKVTGKGIE